MREGVELMRGPAVDARSAGFLIRALRKFAELLARNRDWDEAAEIAAEAHSMAKASQAFDQARQINRLIDEISKRRIS